MCIPLSVAFRVPVCARKLQRVRCNIFESAENLTNDRYPSHHIFGQGTDFIYIRAAQKCGHGRTFWHGRSRAAVVHMTEMHGTKASHGRAASRRRRQPA